MNPFLGWAFGNLFKRWLTDNPPFYPLYQNILFNRDTPILIDTNDLMAVYLNSPFVRLVLEKKAEMFKNMDIKLHNATGEIIDKHELLVLLKNPNPLQSQEDFLAQYSLMKDIYANAFIYPLRATSISMPRVMWNLPSGLMKIKPTGKLFQQTKIEDIIDKYMLIYSTIDKYEFESSEVIHISMGASDQYFVGQSKFISLRTVISNLDSALKTRNIIMSEKGAIGILSSDNKDNEGGIPLSTEERVRIEKEYHRKYGLSDEQMRIIITNASMKWNPMSFPTKDLALFEETEDDFNTICGAYGMARDIFPSTKGATFENQKQATIQTYQNTIQPEADSLMKTLTKWFGLDKQGLMLTADYSWLPLFKEDEGKEADVLGKKISSVATMVTTNIISPVQAKKIIIELTGIEPDESLVSASPIIEKLTELSPLIANNMIQTLTINEVRNLLGLPPITNGDQLIKPQQQNTIP